MNKELKELRQLNKEELLSKVNVLKETLRAFQFKVAANQLKQIHEIAKIKKAIARILTIIKELDSKK